MKPKVLISDSLSDAVVEIFSQRGCEVKFEPDLGKNPEKLIEMISHFEGLAIRSATKVTKKLLDSAENLRVIGRAGIGVDNVDISQATSKGIVVMNTPFGNAITTAEHAIAMMFAVARQIPKADDSTQKGKWEKSKFIGVELTNKVLGIIGCGNIGSIVAERAIGLKMKVIAYDPFLSSERAADIGLEMVTLEELYTRANFVTLHTPLTEKTKNLIDASVIESMRDGVYIINCARGGLVDEVALRNALESGKVAGAAIDVFTAEPAVENVLFGAPNLVCTPHLGASTTEAQENVALQIAEQMSDYLVKGAVSNALNMPSISAEEAPRLTPFVKLSEQLGSFAGQLTETGIVGVRVEYEGQVAQLNTRALTSAILTGLLKPLLQTVNMVSAPAMAKERDIKVEEVRRDQQGVYESYIRLTIRTERNERSVAGTVYSDGKPRVIQVKGINMEAEISKHMLYITNEDKPGFIGQLGTILGNASVNIATFNLGRLQEGGDAIALIEVDGAVTNDVLEEIKKIPMVKQIKPLEF